MEKLMYKKYSYGNKYLKSGIYEIEMHTSKIIRNGVEYAFEIKSSTFQSYYHISYVGFDREKHEKTNGIHGSFHGHHFRDNYNKKFVEFEQVQQFFMEKYGVRLVKDGETIKHHYS